MPWFIFLATPQAMMTMMTMMMTLFPHVCILGINLARGLRIPHLARGLKLGPKGSRDDPKKVCHESDLRKHRG